MFYEIRLAFEPSKNGLKTLLPTRFRPGARKDTALAASVEPLTNSYEKTYHFQEADVSDTLSFARALSTTTPRAATAPVRLLRLGKKGKAIIVSSPFLKVLGQTDTKIPKVTK